MGESLRNRAKTIFRKITRKLGFEVVKYTPQQMALLRSQQNLSHRDFLVEEALLPKGEISVSEAIFLGSLVRNLEDEGPIIEIGTLFGRSTLIMAAQKSIERKLVTVDNYSWNPLGISTETHFRITQGTLLEAKRKLNVHQINSDKNEFYRTYQDASPSLVFLDAVHTYEETKADILWAKHLNTKIICGHDYHKESHPGVVRAVDESGGPKKLVETLWVL
jgi:hypothetical protein